ncbi:MAG TPA: hypothetical protein VLL72_01990 [Kiloniellales bacterium]|nr:hypothetical protein [Kiloniellales bacterium]
MKGLLPIPGTPARDRSRGRTSLLGRWAAALLLAISIAATGAAGAAGPSLDNGWYVARGACPFECCVYRTWRATAATSLHAAPRAPEIVGRLAAGESALAVTGIVYVRPVPVEVIRDHADSNGTRLERGERFLLLDYQGEGIHRIWLNGETRFLDALDLYVVDPETRRTDVTRFDSCEADSPACWWRIAPKNREQRTEWWVKLRADDETEGWSAQPENFTDKDACG